MGVAVLSPQPPIGRRLFTVDEAAAYLRVSRRTVYRELAAHRLPSIRIRSRLVIPEYALERALKAQTRV